MIKDTLVSRRVSLKFLSILSHILDKNQYITVRFTENLVKQLSIMSASVLSPLAAPFHPSTSMPFSMYAPSEFNYVYSDGVPVLVDVQDKDLLHGISDEAIDEAFIPSPDEQAELETVDFVSIL